MPSTLFLGSLKLGALLDVVPKPPEELKTLFVAAAGDVYGEAPWIEDDRKWFGIHRFDVSDLDLSGSLTPEQVVRKVFDADLLYVAGGNTYHLLDCINRSGLRQAIQAHPDLIYAGASAGAVVACPDIAYIGTLDQRELAPGLDSTDGLGLVDIAVLPHADKLQSGDTIAEIEKNWGRSEPLVPINDRQAIVVRDGGYRVVDSR